MATETSLKVRLLNASKTHAEWTVADPVLKKGEIAYSSDKKQIRVGDGSSKWSQLSYIDAGHIVGLSNSGSTITYTKADGSTGTITLPEYDVATSTTPGLVKSGGDITVASDGAVTVNKSTTLKTDKATAAGDRPVWTSWIGDNTKAAYDTDFTYDSTTNTLKVKKIASPELTGTPTAPTATDGTNSTQIATTAFVQNAVGDIELGGRNLITGINPTTITTRTIASSSSGNYVEGITYTITTISGCDTYTASFDAKADADGTVVHCYWYSPNTTTKGKSSTGGTFSSANGGYGDCTITLTTEWKRYWVTWTQNATTEVSKHLILGRIIKPSSGTSTCYYRAPKFEVGNVATDWSPAPEDLVSDITLSGSTLSYKNPIGTQLGSYTLSKSTVGLGNVDNTSDANKPISTATQTALDQITNSIGNAKLFTGICSTAAGTAEKDVTCASFKATDLVKGTRISVYFENTNSANIANLKLDVNGTGAKPIKHIYNGSYANIPSAGYLKAGQIYTFTYDGTNWVVEMMYNSNTTPAYLEYRNNTYAKKAIAANRWIVGDKDGYEEIASGVTFDLSYPILYTNGAVSQGSSNYANMFMQFYDLNLDNLKSGFTSSAKKMIYLVVTISGNTATIDSSIITDTLPTSDDGKAYITLGRLGAQSTGANYFLFQAVHPIFVYRKGALRLYSGSADVVNGHTVDANVPSTAVFTDTKVTQTLSSTNANYPLIFGKNTTSTTTNYTDTVLRNNSIYANPSTGIITAPYYTATKVMRVRNQNFSVANTYTSGFEFILYTGIKFVHGNGMPIVHITGFMYPLYAPIDLLINFYMYSGKICNQGVVDRGGWHPNVYIFKYQKGEVDYIAIALTDGNQRNYISLNADVLDVHSSNTNIDFTAFYWDKTTGDANSVIPEPDNGVTCIEVPYRANYNPKPTLTVQLNSTTLNTYNGTSTVTMDITKSGLGLGNVENKSSATIRGELTASNVTTALGYTPLNKAGDSMSGALALLGNQYGDSYSSYALNLNNSNIVGVNSIYTADLSDNSQEGIHFYRSTTAVDTLYAKNGVLYFVPNRTLGQNGTSYTILNSNNYTSYTQKVNDGNTSYLFNKGAYVGGSGAKKYLRITLPDNQANVWNMFYMEVSLRQHSPSESGGKILIEAMHNASSPYTWTGFNASVLGYLPSTLTVHASDAKYFYILNNTTYASASLDRILVGDTVRSYDISAVTLDWVDELPETHQDATMYYGIHTGNISAHLNDIYVNRSGDTMTGNLTISHATNATMTAESTNPQITFSENGTQPVHLIYTDYDTYRSPAGLKVVGGSSATPAWFEVEGDIYEAGTKISDKYVNVSGDTMTGTLIVPIVQTGTANNNYFQSRKFRGEGGADTYTHAIDFGYAGHNQVDFYEYGGLYQFWKNTSTANTTNAVLLGKITTNGWEGNVVGHASEDLLLTGGQLTGNLTLHSDSGNSPALIFHRGTDTDSYSDWKIVDISGNLYFYSRTGTAGWTQKLLVGENGIVTATTFSGSLTGNATSATALKTSGTILTDLGSTTATTYTSGGNITPGIKGTLSVSHGGTGATTFDAYKALIGNGDNAITASNWATIRQITLNSASATEEGWERICKITATTGSGYCQFLLNLTGGWANAQPTVATFLVTMMHTTFACIKQISGYKGLGGHFTKLRLVSVSGGTYWLDLFHSAQSKAPGLEYLQFFGNVELSDIATTRTLFTDTVTAAATCEVRTMPDILNFKIASSDGTNESTAVDFNGTNTVLKLPSTIKANLTGNVTGNVTGNLTGTVTGHASLDLPLAGGTMTGPLKWKDSNALPQATSASYLLTIDAFASGGTTKWISASSVTVGSATTATTATNLTNFKVTTTTNLGIDAPGTNAIGYVSGLTSSAWNYNRTDGALYTQFYSASWIHEIFGDYRTGHISVRGKNNGTWQDWKRVLDEGNYGTVLDSVYLGISDNAVSATKATQDDSGNIIKATYASSISISGRDITLFNKNNASLGSVTVPESTYLTMYSNVAVTGDDLNSFATINGIQWGKLTDATGIGLSANDGMVIFVPFGNSPSFGRQFVLDDDSNKMFTRYKSGSNWTSSWDQILTKSVADGIYASGDFVSKSGDTITGPVVISGSSASLQVEGYGLYVNASDNTIIGDLLFNGSMDLHGDIVQTSTYHITGSFGYAMLTIQNKAISATSNSAITGFTSSHYNDTLFSHSGDTITIKKHGIYRMVIRWHLSSTSSAASVKNVAWAKSGTTTELGWGCVARANTYDTITSEFLQEISASTILTLIGRSEGGSSTFRGINAWVELVELL